MAPGSGDEQIPGNVPEIAGAASFRATSTEDEELCECVNADIKRGRGSTRAG